MAAQVGDPRLGEESQQGFWAGELPHCHEPKHEMSPVVKSERGQGRQAQGQSGPEPLGAGGGRWSHPRLGGAERSPGDTHCGPVMVGGAARAMGPWASTGAQRSWGPPSAFLSASSYNARHGTLKTNNCTEAIYYPRVSSQSPPKLI